METRQTLLSDLLSSVKQCQIRFGGKSELATESEEVVAKLCSRLEAVLCHGLKAVNNHSSLRQVSEVVGGLLAAPSGPAPPPSHWNYVKLYLNKHELERYMLLRAVNTDAGRGRAWLRSALNEHSLEKYTHMLISDQARLEHHYDPCAFLRDEERSSVLPSMAAGLGSILFAITIDNAALNYWSTPQHDSKEELVAKKANKSFSSSDSQQMKKKNKKRGPVQVVSFDGAKNTRALPKKSLHTDDLERKLLALKSASLDIPEKARRSSDEHQDKSPNLTYEPVHLENASREQRGDTAADEIDIYSRSPTDGMSQLSIDAANEDISSNKEVAKLTPMKNAEVGALIPLSHEAADVESDDSGSVRSYGEDTDYASATSHHNNQASSSGVTVASSEYSSVTSAQNSTLSREDLKQALLSVMERKDELQDQCQTFKKLLEKEALSSASLKEELAEAGRKAKETNEKLDVRIASLSRENELLKHQLKKYVGAVQKLRDGPQAYETLAQLEGKTPKEDEKGNYVDYHYEASEYEKKLIQVAEMHGELLEFNEHLQKVLHNKESLLRRLREELVDLRGPLPDEEDNEDAMSTISEADSHMTAVSSTAGGRSLINIWVPSVFLSGGGSGTHHVYQVYLRIRDEEWNIYRRYSEFYALHKDLQKRERLVSGFDFPPKKTVGNKAEKFVEDRRKRLQTYLRHIVNLMVQTNPSLLAKPDKEQVILLMPFFAENAHLRQTAPVATPNTAPHQRTSIFQRRRTGNNDSTPQLAL